MTTTTQAPDLRERVRRLGLWGLLADWDACHDQSWLADLVDREEAERQRRSLERRVRNARLGRFKPLADFDWTWPKRIDREQVEDLLQLRWIDEAANVVLVGPNGVGKTMIARNLAYQALLAGHTVRFTTASELLNDLAAQDGSLALERRLRRAVRPRILAVDEIGYLSYDNRHADLLFDVVSRRYGDKSTLITTNKPFAEWGEVFPNAACVVSLVDRLVHNAEIVAVEGESYRLKEARERAAARARERAARRKTTSSRKKAARS